MILFGSGAMYDKSRELHKIREDELGKLVAPAEKRQRMLAEYGELAEQFPLKAKRFADESKEYAVCSRCFDRVVDIEEVKSLIMWPDDEGGKDKVEVEIQ